MKLVFAILQCRKKVATLAGCSRCNLNFLTPPNFEDESVTREYLWKKYIDHRYRAVTRQRPEEKNPCVRSSHVTARKTFGAAIPT
jgi:hypothetical protein